MPKINIETFDLGAVDRLSAQDTPIHRLDGRAKLLTTMVFIVAVVSFGRYEVSALIPFLIYPAALCLWGNIPTSFLARKIAVVAPFAVLIGIFNPLIDRQIMMTLGPLEISAGWISFASIIVRFVLTVSAALTLVAVTGFNSVCTAMGRLGVPQIFVTQLMFFYRYLFVLVDESLRMVRARALRTFNGKGTNIRTFGSMVGHLLLRTLDRAQRIHLAMSCRGFSGEIPAFKPLAFGPRDAAFVLGWSALFVGLRFFNLSRLIGESVTGIFT
ncbi:MAG: cobalt ECF transporter T component CbiQ [Candidatus Alcyoniella australis]|nr:cobalt ECF transporter T component CbiQ [Candidatus Alcyoniella australis]